MNNRSQSDNNSGSQQRCGADNPDRLPGDDHYQQMIAEAAYFNAKWRDFAPGNEMSDWLQAEAEVKRLLLGEK
ncbi:DUF2934 domain-containing protein [Propionivibrio sp.]|uniref:DUF2934 domain-containing protein n=1 Tax=Propionivibrio sp. TaxID=2212460 RepID=UPI003BF2980A